MNDADPRNGGADAPSDSRAEGSTGLAEGSAPPKEPPPAQWPSCADRKIMAERSLRIITSNRISSLEAMEMVHSLVDDAGADFARQAIEGLDLPF
ncbi:MAG TPA: hypothetical protein VGW34_09540 [Allosphingosinicella sp.]|nr:hypothetical protein [Allosphingosinicella sp.]